MYLKSQGQFRVETNIFRKFIHGRGLCPIQPPAPLPAARRAQRVKEEKEQKDIVFMRTKNLIRKMLNDIKLYIDDLIKKPIKTKKTEVPLEPIEQDLPMKSCLLLTKRLLVWKKY